MQSAIGEFVKTAEIDMPSKLSRKDTLPDDDPAWSLPYCPPGQPRPLPPRNEPIFYIPRPGRIDNDPPRTVDPPRTHAADSSSQSESAYVRLMEFGKFSETRTIRRQYFSTSPSMNYYLMTL